MAYTGRSFPSYSRNKSINTAIEWLTHLGIADPIRRWQNTLARSTLAQHVFQLTALALLLLVGTLIVYSTGGTGYAYPYVILLPVVLASAWYHAVGGVVSAIMAGLLLGPYMPLDVDLGMAQSHQNWVARLLLYVMIGAFTGLLFQRLKRLTTTDHMTGLPNAQALDQDVHQALMQLRFAQTLRKEASVTVMIIRVLDLWEILEAFGAETSDRVIAQVAHELKAHSPLIQKVYRFSSTELAILVRREGQAGHTALIEQLYTAGDQSLIILNDSVRVQLAVGSHVTDAADADADRLIKRARTALVAAIEADDFHQAFVQTHRSDLPQRIKLVSRVKSALANHEFELFYQPKIDLQRGQRAGSEGLIRWADGQGGHLSPGAFMPKVENTTLITPMTHRVIQLACEFIQRHPDTGPVSINWAARNLMDEGLVQHLIAVVDRVGIKPEDLEIEVTESALIRNPARARHHIEQLRSLGFAVSLDDFGTGYSSFQYLTQLPISGLKIDQAFVRHLEVSDNACTVMKGMIDLAHALKLKVVVEGLETQAQVDIVTRLGADFGQGYCFARPMAEARYVTWYHHAAIGVTTGDPT